MNTLGALLVWLAVIAAALVLVPIVLLAVALLHLANVVLFFGGEVKDRVARLKRVQTPPPPVYPSTVSYARPTVAPVAAPVAKPATAPIRGSLFRYQNKRQLHHGEDFYKLFVDGPWKWSGNQRFAGFATLHSRPMEGVESQQIKLNTGHYFGTTARSAQSEIEHYLGPAGPADYSLLEIDADMDPVLDLTDLAAIRAVADASWVDGNVWGMLAELLDAKTGGAELPSIFGLHARRAGFPGILFFSARAILSFHATRLRDSRYWDEVAEDLEKRPVLESMRARADGYCVVIFSGAMLTRLVRRYRYDNGPWESNPWYGADEKTIDDVCGDYGQDFQAEQERFSYMRAGTPPTSD